MMFGWLILLAILFWAIWKFGPGVPTPPSASKAPDSPEDVLRRRFANGEISKEEFEERLAVLRR